MNKNSNVKTMKIFSFCLVVLLGCGMTAFTKTAPPASGIPPILEKVEFAPENPKTGEDVKVTAVTYSDAKQTEDQPADVVLHYSIDAGKSWEDVAMEQNEDEKKIWTGTIPSQAEDTQVSFYVSVTDDGGNIAAEASLLSADNVEKDTWLPKDAAWVQIYDDSAQKETVDYVDIANVYFTYDADYFYFKQVFQGDLDFAANDGLYVMDIWNMDTLVYKLPHAFIYYRPKLSQVAESGLPKAGIVNTNGNLTNDEFAATKKFDAEVTKNALYWRILRKDLLDSPKSILRVSLKTGTGYREDKMQFWWSQELNYSGIVHVILQSHGYAVEKEK